MENNSSTEEKIYDLTETAVSARTWNQQAILTFNLEDPEAARRLKMMVNVDKYLIALYEISQLLIKAGKYYDPSDKIRYESRYNVSKELVPDFDTIDYISDMFYKILSDNKIDEGELYD